VRVLHPRCFESGLGDAKPGLNGAIIVHREKQETWKRKPADPDPFKAVATTGVFILKTREGWNVRENSSEVSRRVA
jgi:hypothetical protein